MNAGHQIERNQASMITRRKTFSVKTGNRKLEQKRQDARRGTSNSRGYGSRWQSHRKIFLAKYPFCIACTKKPERAKLIDHIIPVRQGDVPQAGESDPVFWTVWNHQPLCQMHHLMKTNMKDPEIIASRHWLLNQMAEVDESDRRNRLIELSGVWDEWLDLQTGEVIRRQHPS